MQVAHEGHGAMAQAKEEVQTRGGMVQGKEWEGTVLHDAGSSSSGCALQAWMVAVEPKQRHWDPATSRG